MKGIFKLCALAAIGVLAIGAGAAAGCNNDKKVNGTFTGEYSYENYGTTYGVKVEVVVEDDVVKSVTPVESAYVEVTPDMGDWKAENWTAHEAEVYNKYVGKTVEQILAIKVACDESGAPITNDDSETEITYDGLLHTGATLSSGRLLLAVQDALKS